MLVPCVTSNVPVPVTDAALSFSVALMVTSFVFSGTVTLYSVTSLENSGLSSKPSTDKLFKLLSLEYDASNSS